MTKTCAYCQAEFTGGPLAKFCGGNCRALSRYYKLKTGEIVSGRSAHCVKCGVVVVTAPTSSATPTCRPCWMARGRTPLPIMQCAGCGADFTPHNRHGKYCGRVCSNRAANAKRRVATDYYLTVTDQKVKGSGGGSARTRARRWGLVYQAIDPAVIYKRDKWQCKLCCEHVDKILKHPDPMSATLDHIIPMSMGGGHTPSNVQLAHLRCNTSKGARGDYQLAMPMVGALREVRTKKVKVKRPPQTCALCESQFEGRARKYCTPDCMSEMNARIARERYRASVGLPPTWDRSVKRHAV